MTLRQAAFLVASDEVAKAKDFYWLVYCNPKLPRSSLKKARLAVHAAEMRAARILSTNVGVLPAVLRLEIELKAKGGDSVNHATNCQCAQCMMNKGYVSPRADVATHAGD